MPWPPENKLIFMTGPLTGTLLPATTRFQLATKSPETRIYLCSNYGGTFGMRLEQAGYNGLIVEGRASGLMWLSIAGGTVGFEDARDLTGYVSYRMLTALREAFGGRESGARAIRSLLAEGMYHVRRVRPEWSRFFLAVTGRSFTPMLMTIKE